MIRNHSSSPYFNLNLKYFLLAPSTIHRFPVIGHVLSFSRINNDGGHINTSNINKIPSKSYCWAGRALINFDCHHYTYISLNLRNKLDHSSASRRLIDSHPHPPP